MAKPDLTWTNGSCRLAVFIRKPYPYISIEPQWLAPQMFWIYDPVPFTPNLSGRQALAIAWMLAKATALLWWRRMTRREHGR